MGTTVVVILIAIIVIVVLSSKRRSSVAGDSANGSAPRTSRSTIKPTEVATVEDIAIPEGAIDLRSLPSRRVRIVGMGNYMTDRARTNRKVSTWMLRREKRNSHDENAVAVHLVGGKKVGYISAAQAQALAPILDPIGDVFIVSGVGSAGTSSTKMWIDLPSLPALRTWAKKR